MINAASIQSVRDSVYGSAGLFRAPLYGSYCFSGIPHEILRSLTGSAPSAGLPSGCVPDLASGTSTWDQVVVIFVDGLGWRHLEDYHFYMGHPHPLFAQFQQEGIISMITSQFPSTTSAHVTALATGLSPSESGVFEWEQYSPELGDSVKPLAFTQRYGGRFYSLPSLGTSGSVIYPSPTLYEMLKQQAGIESLLITTKDIAASPAGTNLAAGARVVGYERWNQGKQLVPGIVSNASERYIYYYLDDLDKIAHEFGYGSPEYVQFADKLLTMLSEVVYSLRAQGRLVILTADHGHVTVQPRNPARAIALDTEAPWIWSQSKTISSGNEPRRASGSIRDAFLHIRENEVNSCVSKLNVLLSGRAEAFATSDLWQEGFFGPTSGDSSLLERLGTVAVLPYEDYCVTFANQFEGSLKMLGYHGGMTPHEMEIPFCAITG